MSSTNIVDLIIINSDHLLAKFILQPNSLTNIPFCFSRERSAASGANSAGGPHREAWSNKSSAYADLYTQNVVINMDEQDEQQKQATEGSAPKERPVWMTQSTVHGAYNESDVLKTRK